MTAPVDVLIIGAGASGAAVAWSLAETKMHILCIEQGDWMKPSEYPSTARDWEARQFDDFHISANRRKRDADYPVNDTGSPIKIANFNGVGGGTVLYAGHFPRFDPSDFRVRSLDGVADDWPIHYATLEPFYAENDRIMGVSGLAGDPAYPPHEPMMPPLPLGKSGATLARGLTSSAGTGGHRTVQSHRWITRAAQSAPISAIAPRAARKAQRRAPTSPTGPPPSAPASSCIRAVGCARLPPTNTAWRRGWSITTQMGSSISSLPKSSSSPATPSARRAFC